MGFVINTSVSHKVFACSLLCMSTHACTLFYQWK